MTRDLSAWIEQHAVSSPDRVAIRFEGTEISYRALHVRIPVSYTHLTLPTILLV